MKDQKLPTLIRILDEVEENVFELNVVGKEVKKFSKLQKKQVENLKQQVLENGLDPVIEELIIFLF